MKTSLSVVLVLFVAVAAEASEVAVPPLEECQEIFVFIDGAWMVTFKADGSGGIQYGSLFGDGKSFSKGTIDFAKLYQSLVPTLVATNSTDRQKARVPVTFQGKQSVGAYTGEVAVIEQAFYKGIDAVGREPVLLRRLEYLALWSPPLREPDDDPPWRFRKPRESAEIVKQLQVLEEMNPDVYEQIGIYTRTGWKLTINTDGSGELSIGRDPSMTATFGPKTFDFAQTYKDRIQQPLRDMIRGLNGERAPEPATDSMKIAIIIGAKPAKKRMQPMLLAPDPLSIKEVFDQAWQSATRLKKDSKSFVSMEDVWRTQPPVELNAELK